MSKPTASVLFWSDEISFVHFSNWFSETQKEDLDPVTFRRSLASCERLWRGEGLPMSYLTPRKRFAAGKPLNHLLLDFKGMQVAAEDIANVYGGHAGQDLVWCLSRFKAYQQEIYPLRLSQREKCTQTFLRVIFQQPPNSSAFTLASLEGVTHQILSFVLGEKEQANLQRPAPPAYTRGLGGGRPAPPGSFSWKPKPWRLRKRSVKETVLIQMPCDGGGTPSGTLSLAPSQRGQSPQPKHPISLCRRVSDGALKPHFK